MSKRDDARIDELLARGTLGGPQYDQIFEQVLARTAEAESPHPAPPVRLRSRGITWALAALVPVAAVAAWLVLVPASGRDQRLRPKGAAPPGAPVTGALEVGCAPSGRRSCRLGDTLIFTVNAAITWGHLSAYAERADDPAHARIGYFPAGGAAAGPVIAPGHATVVVPEGIRIGPEHRPGSYRITVWTSDDAGAIRSRATLNLEIVP